PVDGDEGLHGGEVDHAAMLPRSVKQTSLVLHGQLREESRVPPRSVALAVLVAVIWGANFVVIDLGLGDLPPTLFVALRFVVVLVPAIWLLPRPTVARGHGVEV